MKKIAVLTSGGDAPGMNAAVRAAVRAAVATDIEVYGVYHGYEGLLDENIVEFDRHDVGNILHSGGTILRTARCKRFFEDKWIDAAVENLRKRGIDGLVAIGGDGTLKGAQKLAERGMRVMLVPATIDNDMAYTDYCIGFDTAVNTVLDIIGKLRDTAASHEKTTIVQVMGRECGDIALYAGVAGGADAVLIPEHETNYELLADFIHRGQKSGKHHAIVIAAEGIKETLPELQEKIENITGNEVRLVIPGYIQRGGTPTAKDRIIASATAARAVELLCSTEEGSYAIGERDGKLFEIEISEALKCKKKFNINLYKLGMTLA